RFLRTGNRKLWLLLGLIAGIACMTKMTLIYLGPGFLIALLFSKYRKDLLTPWPWLGAAICVVVVSPYLIWQIINHWPTLEYWKNYGTWRVYQASISQYLTNMLIYMNPFLLPLWIGGLYRIFRRINGVSYRFLGFLFAFTLVLMFTLHASARMLAELFIPLIAASAIFVEEILAGIRWENGVKTLVTAYLLIAGLVVIPSSLPILPANFLPVITKFSDSRLPPLKEFNGGTSSATQLLAGRIGWDELARVVAGVYNDLPPEDRKVAGIYADVYPRAGAIDLYGPMYGLPHAVSGSLTYYLWGPGYTWDVMIIISGGINNMSMFFDECEQKAIVQGDYDATFFGHPNIFVCRKPKVAADKIWSSAKSYR
ncbi:MAG TPA: glycosyltransferase family 39 protein, partial [Leptolinea sp.]